MRSIVFAVALTAASVTVPAMAAPCAGFVDVDDTSPFCANVTWAKNRGVTQGCAVNLYCPDAPVSRLAMAAFLNRLGDAVLPRRVLWVSDTGGTFQTIQAAVDHAVAQGASSFSRWLVKIAPGTYNERVVMAAGVDVEGSGTGQTLITSSALLGTVATAGTPSELRHVTVENTAANPHPTAVSAAVWHNGGDSRLVDVVLRGTSAYAVGAYVAVGHLRIERSRIVAQGTTHADGLRQGNGRVWLTDVDIVASTTGGLAQGITVSNGELYADRARIDVPSANATATGLRLAGGILELDNATIGTHAAGASAATPARALWNSATATVRNSTLSATGHTAIALRNEHSTEVHASALLANGTNASSAFENAGTVARAAHSQIVGTTSSVTCFGSYDAAFSPVVCP